MLKLNDKGQTIMCDATTDLATDDGVPVTAAKNQRGFYDICVGGVLIAHAMVPTTAQITMEETVKCWNEEAGLYTYEGENPFPQYIPQLLAAFPQHTAAINATKKKRS